MSDALIKVALDVSRDATIVFDAQGNVIFVNLAARKLLGSSLDDVPSVESAIVQSFRDMCEPPNAIEPDRLPLRRVLAGEKSAELDAIKGDESAGSVRYFRLLASRADAKAADSAIVLVICDMTAERLAGAAVTLRDRAMSAAAEGITIGDCGQSDIPLIYVNDGFVSITGYSREDVLGRNCRFLQGPETDEAACAKIRAAIHDQLPCVVELVNYRKDGTPFWNRLSITPILDAKGTATHFVGIQSDVTERVETEKRLQVVTEELRKVNQQLMRDLKSAAQIQRAQLPPTHLQLPGMRVAWYFEPCDALAGDMLNVVQLDDDHIALYVLDVSGHGTGAALLSTSVSKLLQPGAGLASLVYHGTPSANNRAIAGPGSVLDELNKTYAWNAESNQFFTILYAIVHPAMRQIRFSGAGHPSPIVISKNGEWKMFRLDGLPIGITDDSYNETTAILQAGDRVLIYSDGLVEAMNDAGKIFGEERVIQIARNNTNASLDETVAAIREALICWRGGKPVQDDVTFIAFELV
ncbi:MAG: SpoIIE family protein phosphatase [Candidatus Hydrogenedentes bacterium]|nr:SpoIIE family protein phosphatase [Candidatus Hydrogenedentota bacterium]